VSDAPTPTAFERFVAELRDVGYAADPAQLAAAQHLLLLVAAGAWPGAVNRVGALLAPVFAQSALQQADLLQRVARWQHRLLPTAATPPVVPIPPMLRAPALAVIPDTKAGQVAVVKRAWWRGGMEGALLVLGLAMTVGLLVWWMARPVPVVPPPPATVSIASPNGRLAGMVGGFRSVNGPVVTDLPTSAFYAAGLATPPAWSAPIPVLLGLLPPLLGFAIWRVSHRQRRRLRHRAATAPRDLAELSVVVPAMPLFEGLASELAARDLARPRRLASDEPDIDLSVDATVRAAGLARLVPRERSTTPSYVLLVEEVGRHDHLARLGDRLADRMQEAGVLAERFYVASPSVVRSPDGRVENLDDIAAHHPDHRLLIIGPGEAVADPRGLQLTEALRAEASWADRGYLVAGQIDALTVRWLTEEGFAVVPATPDGIRALGRHIAGAPREGGEVLAPLPGVTAARPVSGRRRDERSRDDIRPVASLAARRGPEAAWSHLAQSRLALAQGAAGLAQASALTATAGFRSAGQPFGQLLALLQARGAGLAMPKIMPPLSPSPFEPQLTSEQANAAEAPPSLPVSTAHTELIALAIEYELVREQMIAGPERTGRMTDLFDAMEKLGSGQKMLLPELLNSQSPGRRLAAIAILRNEPDPERLDWLASRLDPEMEPPFVGYQAAVALHAAAVYLPEEFRDVLFDCLRKARALALRNENDPPRIEVLDSALRELDDRPLPGGMLSLTETSPSSALFPMAKLVRFPITIENGYCFALQLLVGTPAVPISVLLDTGSSMLAVNAGPYRRDADTAASSSQLLQRGSFRGVNFLAAVVLTQVGLPADGTAAVTLPTAGLGVVYETKPSLFGNADGILGLAYPALNQASFMPADTWQAEYTLAQVGLGQPAGTLPSYLDQLVAAGVVANKFAFAIGRSVWSATNPSLNSGVFVLGGGEECSDLYTGGFASVAVVHDAYYHTNLLAVQVGRQTIQVAPTSAGNPAVSNSFIDSSNGGLMLDPSLYQQVIALFNAVDSTFGPMLQGRSHNQSQLDLAAWPALGFILQGTDSTRTTIAVEPKDYWQFDGIVAGTATARLSSGGAPNPGQSILGLPLFAGHYVVFDRTGGAGRSVIKFAARRDPDAAPLEA
jgi:hypothetical protein